MLPLKSTHRELGQWQCLIFQGVIFNPFSSDIVEFMEELLENRASFSKEMK